MLEPGMRQEPCWAQFLSKPEEGHLLGTKTRALPLPSHCCQLQCQGG